MEPNIFQEIGLTHGESRVYISLLKIGESSVGLIAKEAEVSLSKIYEILGNLIRKGLVSSINKNNVKYFAASDPSRIIDYLEEKKRKIQNSEEKVKEILPNLISQINSSKLKSEATIYEGINGVKTFYEILLKNSDKKDIVYGMGIPKSAAEEFEGYFIDWHKRRIKKSIELKAIYNFDAKIPGKKREKLRLTEIRYLSEKFTTPAWIVISKNLVAIIHIINKPICIVIEDKDISESYMNFFNLFWKHSK